MSTSTSSSPSGRRCNGRTEKSHDALSQVRHSESIGEGSTVTATASGVLPVLIAIGEGRVGGTEWSRHVCRRGGTGIAFVSNRRFVARRRDISEQTSRPVPPSVCHFEVRGARG